uniref:Cytochrome P450 monooxygenase n=1 Tax=Trametes versicolor TaxID=5325 RepID=A0AA86J3K4_TRAVE|nr:cytochrome P450 monooxygenase [Trametes versicolor]
MGLTTPTLGVILLTAFLYGAWRFYGFLHIVYLTPLSDLPGPPSSSWVYGNMRDIAAVDENLLPDTWFMRYGKNLIDREFFMRPRVWSLDTRAIQHVLSHPNDFPRTDELQRSLRDLLGAGLLSVWGEEHRRQRRILNPAFGPAQIRDLTHIFVEKANELREYWTDAAARSGSVRVNVNDDLSKLTLDIIGQAGFGYDFNAMNPEEKPNELYLAFKGLFMTNPPIFALMPILLFWFPILKRIPMHRTVTVKHASETVHRIGAQLVAQRKTAILREASEKHLKREDLPGRDLLTLLVRANMAEDIPESQRLSDEDVVNQIPTFLLAGHETTSAASTWVLYSLSRYPQAQQKLREELFSIQSDSPTMDELSALPYLDAVVTETLRLHSPTAMLVRVAAKDDVIPLSEPFTDRHGKMHSEIRVTKGQKFVVPVMALHRSAEIWGEDAREFRPERWQQPPEGSSAIPGVWGRLLTFIGGPRSCIGYRFAVVELKAILFTLVRAFEFELAVPVDDIVVKTTHTGHPSLRSEPEKGYQLPLIIRPYKAA